MNEVSHFALPKVPDPFITTTPRHGLPAIGTARLAQPPEVR